MTVRIPFAFVDVFAREPLTGNPLALVPDADTLDDATMRAIAREFNQSETTFLVAPGRAGTTVRLRSFTPGGVEVLGAGHNAMGAWIWLAANGHVGDGDHTQQIGEDVLPVQVATAPNGQAVVTMRQSAPSFGATVADAEPLAAALGLDAEDIDGAVAYARFFNPMVGIAEDPATGTAAGPLVAALVARGEVAPGVEAIVEQGFALGRPSRLRVTVDGDDVRLSGTGLVVAEGTLLL